MYLGETKEIQCQLLSPDKTMADNQDSILDVRELRVTLIDIPVVIQNSMEFKATEPSPGRHGIGIDRMDERVITVFEDIFSGGVVDQ